ncbi:hypothetical protein C8R43DRAFT_1129625 [Mycena crocata]|nr:hypothetical protein C8R43DRAFT_1129625 [Mycena crocata]
MAPPPWTTVEQKQWLHGHLGDYVEAKEGQITHAFFAGMETEWWTIWPEEGSGNPSPTPTEREALSQAFKKRRETYLPYTTDATHTFPAHDSSMAPPSWATAPQLEWLNARMGRYMDSKTGGDQIDFFIKTDEEWFKRWSEEAACGLPARDSPQPMTAEETARLSSAVHARKQQLRSWYRNKTNTTRKAGGLQTAVKGEVTLAGDYWGGKKRTRDPQLVELYQQRYKGRVKEALTAAGFDKIGADDDWVAHDGQQPPQALAATLKGQRADRMRMMRSVSTRLFENETEEIKREMEAELEKVKANKIKGDQVAALTPRAAQKSLEQVEMITQDFLQRIYRNTGWIGFAMIGGPMPNQGGQLATTVISSGQTPAGNNFRRSHPDWQGGIGTHFSGWLKRCYTRSERDAMALDVDPLLEDLLQFSDSEEVGEMDAAAVEKPKTMKLKSKSKSKSKAPKRAKPSVNRVQKPPSTRASVTATPTSSTEVVHAPQLMLRSELTSLSSFAAASPPALSSSTSASPVPALGLPTPNVQPTVPTLPNEGLPLFPRMPGENFDGSAARDDAVWGLEDSVWQSLAWNNDDVGWNEGYNTPLDLMDTTGIGKDVELGRDVGLGEEGAWELDAVLGRMKASEREDTLPTHSRPLLSRTDGGDGVGEPTRAPPRPCFTGASYTINREVGVNAWRGLENVTGNPTEERGSPWPMLPSQNQAASEPGPSRPVHSPPHPTLPPFPPPHLSPMRQAIGPNKSPLPPRMARTSEASLTIAASSAALAKAMASAKKLAHRDSDLDSDDQSDNDDDEDETDEDDVEVPLAGPAYPVSRPMANPPKPYKIANSQKRGPAVAQTGRGRGGGRGMRGRVRARGGRPIVGLSRRNEDGDTEAAGAGTVEAEAVRRKPGRPRKKVTEPEVEQAAPEKTSTRVPFQFLQTYGDNGEVIPLPLDTDIPVLSAAEKRNLATRQKEKDKPKKKGAKRPHALHNPDGNTDLVVLPRLPGAPMPPVPETGRPGRLRRAPKNANDDLILLAKLTTKRKAPTALEGEKSKKQKNSK